MHRPPSAKSNLYFTHPAIAKEWHPAKNGSLTPKDPMLNYNRKVWWLCSKDHIWAATVNERIHGKTCPSCSDEKEDDKRIPQAFDPALAKEWHPTKNESLKVWWLCSNGHEWPATCSERIQGKSCPYCSGKEIKGETPDKSEKEESHPEKTQKKESTADSIRKESPENCLQAVNPNLAKEWHPTKNESLTPNDVTAISHDQVWWMCSRGHEWKAAISSRNKGQGCFYCSYMHKRKRS